MSSWESEGRTDEWFTPPYIFDALGVRFDLDVAAPPAGPRHVPCADYIALNSLTRPWFGFVWMNPPYGKRNGLEPWLRKFIDHANGICLVPDRTSAPWFQRAARQMEAIIFVRPKIKFERPDGTIGTSPGCGSALMAIGARGVTALTNGKTLGLLVSPAAGIEREKRNG